MIVINITPPSVRRKKCGLRVLQYEDIVAGGLVQKKLLIVGLVVLSMAVIRQLFLPSLGVVIRVNPSLYHLLLLIVVSQYFTPIFAVSLRTQLNYILVYQC